jgi:hypothetical protein
MKLREASLRMTVYFLRGFLLGTFLLGTWMTVGFAGNFRDGTVDDTKDRRLDEDLGA